MWTGRGGGHGDLLTKVIPVSESVQTAPASCMGKGFHLQLVRRGNNQDLEV